MASFCGSCGKPLTADGRFCGGCGAPNAAGQQPAPQQPAIAAVKRGSPALKIVLALLLLGGAFVVLAGAGAIYLGRKKLAQLRGHAGANSSLFPGARSSGATGAAFLTKEEVGTIIGVPVTTMEMSSQSDAHYRTANPMMEASIEIEQKDSPADAIQSIDAARLVTSRAFGGKAEAIPGLGDDALYGAFNVLYVRHNDVILTIAPPHLQQAAQMAQYNNVTSQPMGSEGQKQALEQFQESMKGDPAQASLAKPDAMSGALDLIKHSATEQGNEYETKARLMARQMAERVLSKLGA